jgi:hypothetical protein
LGETALASVTLQPAGRKFVAAIWFASFGLLATVIFFHQLSMATNAAILYIVLPSLSLGIAGFIWGGAILDPSRVKSHGESLMKGLGVTVGAYVIFALLYANGLPLLEAGWSPRQAGGLLFFTLTFGLLFGGPMAAVAGMIAATSLFSFGHYLSRGLDGRKSETSNR